MKRARLGPQLGLFLLLAIGFAAAWGFLTVFVTESFVRPLASAPRTYEQLAITEAGEPLVYRYTTERGVQDSQYRTLDGKAVDRPEWTLSSVSVQRSDAMKPRGGFDAAWVDWHYRLLTASECRTPAVTWYIIRDAEASGHVYLAGYDEQTRLNVGYIDRTGFREIVPPVADQFDVGGSRYLMSGRIAGRGLGYSGFQEAAGLRQFPEWVIYLADNNRVVEIDLRERRVRPLLESPDVGSIGILLEANWTRGGIAVAGPVEGAARRREEERLAVRLNDRVALIDPESGDRSDFVLPESLRGAEWLRFCRLEENKALVELYLDDGPWVVNRLVWFDAEGTISREQDVDLARSGGNAFETFEMFSVTAAVPMPAFLGFVFGVVPPSYVAEGRAATLGEAWAKLFGDYWPACLIVLAMSAAAVWGVVRLQRNNGRARTALWSGLVFLFGLPGLMAYVSLHRRAPRGACPTCDATTPRNRESCTQCGAEFPLPRRLGTEVFA
jgi:hypothetical protein